MKFTPSRKGRPVLDDLLEQFVRLGLNEKTGMGLLAESNTISDEVIRAWSIADADLPNAINWLKKQKAR